MKKIDEPKKIYPVESYHLGYLLCKAVTSKNLNNVKEILSNGADIHFGDDHPLNLALSYQQEDIATYLLNNGANVHGQKKKFLTLAVDFENLPLVKLLVEKGADTFYKKERAFKRSIKNDNLDIILYFVEKGHDINLALSRCKKNTKDALYKYINTKEFFYTLDQSLPSNKNNTRRNKI